MNVIGAILGGLFGGLIGGAIWLAIGYFTGYEVGIVAWLVGLGCGAGVAAGGRHKSNKAGGVLAASIAILSILGARFAVVSLLVHNMMSENLAMSVDEVPGAEDDEFWVAFVSDEIMEDRLTAGDELEWPDDEAYENEDRADDYPADVWAEALGTWNSMSASERDEFCTAGAQLIVQRNTEGAAAAGIFLSVIAFFASFGLLDIVFAFLAIGTAYRVGCGGGETEATADADATLTDAQPASQLPPQLRPHPVASASTPAPATAPHQTAPARPVQARSVQAATDSSQLPPQFRMHQFDSDATRPTTMKPQGEKRDAA